MKGILNWYPISEQVKILINNLCLLSIVLLLLLEEIHTMPTNDASTIGAHVYWSLQFILETKDQLQSIAITDQLVPLTNCYHSYHWSISICRLQFSAIFGISSQKVVTSILLNCLTNLFAKWIEYSMLNIHNYCGQWEITFIDKKKLQHFIFT